MKKFLLVIPLLVIFIHLLNNADAGPLAWTQDLTNSGPIWQTCIVINSTNPQIMYAGSATNGVYKSTNGGATWVQVNSGLTYLNINAMGISPSNPSVIYAGTDSLGGSNSGVYKSTNDGATWTLTPNTIFPQRSIQAIAVSPTDPNTVLIGIFNALANSTDGLYKTTNGGTTWAIASTGLTNKNILSLISNPLNANVYYAGSSLDVVTQTGPVHIYKTVNAGATWTDMSTGLPGASDNDPVRVLSISTLDTARVLAGLFQNTVAGGAFLTTNGGNSWTRMSTGIPNLVAFQIRAILIKPGSNTEFYAGTDPATSGGVGGVYRTTDGGTSWTVFNGGPMTTTNVVRSLAFRIPDQTLFAGVAGTSGMGVYDYSFGPVGINDPNNGLPKTFSLKQNYPNPFNPSTVIQYAVPKASLVTIKVYDMTGREIKTLVNDFKNAGTFEINFNASNLASGVYFYKIQAGEFRDTKKMMLVK